MKSPARYTSLSTYKLKAESCYRLWDLPLEIRIKVWKLLAQDSTITIIPLRHAKYESCHGRPATTAFETRRLSVDGADVKTIIYDSVSNFHFSTAALAVQGPASQLLAISPRFHPDVLYALYRYATYEVPFPKGTVHLPHPRMATVVQNISTNAQTFASANRVDVFDQIAHFPNVKHIALIVDATSALLRRPDYYQKEYTIAETKAHLEHWIRHGSGSQYAGIMPWHRKSYKNSLERAARLYYIQAAQDKKIGIDRGLNHHHIYSKCCYRGENSHPNYVAKV